jgi:hypothetical protein
MNWPHNKSFAFTIFDDTDNATLANVGPVYSFLTDLGFRITKSVWPLEGTTPNPTAGETCENPRYLEFIHDVSMRGHEIGYHMATWHSSDRDRTILALKRFEELFGKPPHSMANHSQNAENLYWGADRLTGIRKLIYNAVTLGKHANTFRGHVEGDPLFWGDLCREKITYVRSFVYPEINTLDVCPFMPYHDERRPYVRYWFASSEGATITSFNNLLFEANQDRLESEGGACIVYTHLGAGFCVDGVVNERFKALMTRLSKKNGWFAPVSTILDHLRNTNGHHTITPSERSRLEWRWLLNKLISGRS